MWVRFSEQVIGRWSEVLRECSSRVEQFEIPLEVKDPRMYHSEDKFLPLVGPSDIHIDLNVQNQF